MKASNHRTVLSAVLATVAVAAYTAPADAMGRSGTRSTQPPVTQTADRLGRVEAEQQNVATVLQSQVEALRQELADLKARVERQDVAVAE